MSRYSEREKSIWNKAIYSVTREMFGYERAYIECDLTPEIRHIINLARKKVLYKKNKAKNNSLKKDTTY